MEVLSKLKINSYTSKNITISSQTKRFTHPVLSLYLDKLDCLDKHDVNNSRTSSFFVKINIYCTQIMVPLTLYTVL